MGIGAAFHSLLEFCFPWSCAVCKAGFEGRGPLCSSCSAELQGLEEEPCCGVCAMTLPMHGSPCPYCMGKGAAHFERVVRLGPYTDPLRVMIHHLKYHRRWTLGEELADRLLERESVKGLLQQSDVLVPVPLHWRRQLPRGYNQAEVIAGRLAGRCRLRVARPVRRARHTETQTHLYTRARREANLKGAFVLRDAKCVEGRHVVVVDDVWTTGATLHAIARVLKEAKPASLSALVLATADPKGFERVDKH